MRMGGAGWLGREWQGEASEAFALRWEVLVTEGHEANSACFVGRIFAFVASSIVYVTL